MAYYPDHFDRDFEDWIERPEKTARLYRFDSKLKGRQKDRDHAVEKWIGNILTDRKWWREKPETAYNTTDEDFKDRLGFLLKRQRGLKPFEEQREEFFHSFFDKGDYYVSGLYSDKAGISTDSHVDERLYHLLEKAERKGDDKPVKEAFMLLDSFNYGRTVDEFNEIYETDYLSENGPELVIDQVASDVLSRLDGSAKAFFQMYIAPREYRPQESFRNETVAETYNGRGYLPRKKSAYIEDGLEEFEKLFAEEDLEQAKKVVSRFDLPAHKVMERAHRHNKAV